MGILICPKCGNGVSDKAKNCPKCNYNYKLYIKCPECKKLVIKDNPICEECGFPLTEVDIVELANNDEKFIIGNRYTREEYLTVYGNRYFVIKDFEENFCGFSAELVHKPQYEDEQENKLEMQEVLEKYKDVKYEAIKILGKRNTYIKYSKEIKKRNILRYISVLGTDISFNNEEYFYFDNINLEQIKQNIIRDLGAKMRQCTDLRDLPQRAFKLWKDAIREYSTRYIDLVSHAFKLQIDCNEVLEIYCEYADENSDYLKVTDGIAEYLVSVEEGIEENKSLRKLQKELRTKVSPVAGNLSGLVKGYISAGITNAVIGGIKDVSNYLLDTKDELLVIQKNKEVLELCLDEYGLVRALSNDLQDFDYIFSSWLITVKKVYLSLVIEKIRGNYCDSEEVISRYLDLEVRDERKKCIIDTLSVFPLNDKALLYYIADFNLDYVNSREKWEEVTKRLHIDLNSIERQAQELLQYKGLKYESIRACEKAKQRDRELLEEARQLEETRRMHEQEEYENIVAPLLKDLEKKSILELESIEKKILALELKYVDKGQVVNIIRSFMKVSIVEVKKQKIQMEEEKKRIQKEYDEKKKERDEYSDRLKELKYTDQYSLLLKDWYIALAVWGSVVLIAVLFIFVGASTSFFVSAVACVGCIVHICAIGIKKIKSNNSILMCYIESFFELFIPSLKKSTISEQECAIEKYDKLIKEQEIEMSKIQCRIADKGKEIDELEQIIKRYM